MKKILLSFLMLFGIVGLVKADENDGYGRGFGGQKMWLTSATTSNDEWGIISTGSIVLAGIRISSWGYNSEIKFIQCSTSTPAGKFVHFGATVPFANGSGIPTNAIGKPYEDVQYIMKSTTAGWAYKTTGDLPAKLEILYDYDNPRR